MTEKEGRAVKLPQINWGVSIWTVGAVLATSAFNYGVASYRLDASDKRAEKYVPMIEEMVRKNIDQDNRLENVIDSVKEIRRVSNEQLLAQSKTNSELLTQLSAIRENLAWFRAKAELNSPASPFKP